MKQRNKYKSLALDLSCASEIATMLTHRMNDNGKPNDDTIFIQLHGYDDDKTCKAIYKAKLHTTGRMSFLYDGYCIDVYERNNVHRDKIKIIYEYLKNLGYDVKLWKGDK